MRRNQHALSLFEFAQIIERLHGKKASVAFSEQRVGDKKVHVSD